MLSEGDARKINSVRKLDLTDTFLVPILYRVYKCNMSVVFFWLRYCMLGLETTQFPARLKASAFHIAAHAPCRDAPVGFSGTKDHYRLLPCQVKQFEHELPTCPLSDIVSTEVKRMLATDGLMVHLLTDPNKVEYYKLPGGSQDLPLPSTELSVTSTPTIVARHEVCNWRILLDFAIERGASALIDAGALLAGVSTEDSARYVLQKIESMRALGKFSMLRAVVFFHEGVWKVCDFGGSVLPLRVSPITEKEAFVIFDEHHCRGADMKLQPDALAVLTLGPKMCKDKLVQAAGRMRQLGSGQRLVLAAQDEVHDAIFQSTPNASPSLNKEESEMGDILHWIMTNTLQASMAGLTECIDNGIHFAETTEDPDKAKIPEKTALADMYSSAIKEASVSETFERKINCTFGSREKLSNAMKCVVEKVEQSSRSYGKETMISISSMSEECERERELEQQQQEEREVESPVQKPAQEVDWDYSLVVSGSFSEVRKASSTISLKRVIRHRLAPATLSAIKWGDETNDVPNVWVTNNFVFTLESDENLNSFLRGVDTLLVWADGMILLLSDREANGVVEEMRRRDCDHAKPFLVQFHVLRKYFIPPKHNINQPQSTVSTPRLVLPVLQSSPPATRLQAVKPLSVAQLLLFNGETKFGGPDNKLFPLLKSMLSTVDARDAALHFTDMRDTALMRKRSDLERACGAEGKA